MSSTLERATSGRSRCRGCNESIEKGSLRLGERLPNPFAEGEMVLWFHPLCAAHKRPAAMLEALAALDTTVEVPPEWEAAALHASSQRRLPRIDGAERAARSQARCRSCREPIARGTWRVRLVYFDEGRFEKSGFVHLACCPEYFETADVAGALFHFSPSLAEDDRAELQRELEALRAG